MPSQAPQKKRLIDKTRAFLQRDVWDIEISALNRVRRAFIRTVRVLLLVLSGFKRDECVLHASSLTFMTLLSFIPVLAIALSMARSFGDVNLLRDRLKESLHEWIVAEESEVESPKSEVQGPKSEVESPKSEVQGPKSEVQGPKSEVGGPESGVGSAAEDPDFGLRTSDSGLIAGEDPDFGLRTSDSGLIAEEERAEMMGRQDEAIEANALTVGRLDGMIDTAFERIGRLNFGALGGIGVALLLWTVISVLGQVEAAFNRVWGVTKQRSIYRKFTDYLSVVVVVPLLLTAASTIPATSLLSRLASATGGAENAVAFPVRFLRSAGMMALLTLSLAFVLRFMPNAKVRFWPGLGGGFLVAVAMTAWLRICLTFQIGLAKYSTFFGSFAVVPLLLFWVYVSWIILLVGAEFSFGLQNSDTYLLEGDSQQASQRTRALLALDLAAAAARSVSEGDGLLKSAEWIQGHRIPVRLVNDVLSVLVRHGMLVETSSGGGEYAVRFNPERATVSDVLLVMLDDGDEPASVGVKVPEKSPLGGLLDGKLAAALSTRLADLKPADLL